MQGMGHLTQTLWALAVAAQLGLFALLTWRKVSRQFPALLLYLVVTIAQAAALFLTYRTWGFNSPTAFRVAWGTQCLVLLARGNVVLELCRHVLGRFRGIWAMCRWMLLSCGLAVLCYAAYVTRRDWNLALTTAELALELATASIIVLLLLFARYYEIEVPSHLRLLALGLCFYSGVAVLNDAVLERWLASYVSVWNTLETTAFLVCLTLWSVAFRNWRPTELTVPVGVEQIVYRKLVPEVNWQLQLLNRQLIRLWRLEAPRT